MSAEAYYSEEHRCWFVPVATELISDEELLNGVSPVQIQLRDGTLWITRLPREAGDAFQGETKDGGVSSYGFHWHLPFGIGVDLWHDGQDGFAPPIVLRRRPYLRFVRILGTRYFLSVGRLPL